jgi:hypothetical protein
MDQMQKQQTPQKSITNRELLEKGLALFIKVLNQQPVHVNRTEMADLLNFEVALNTMIAQMKEIEGKSEQELMDLAIKNLKPPKPNE